MTTEDKKEETTRTNLTRDEESKVEQEFEINGIQDDQYDDAKDVIILSEPTDVEDLKDDEAVTPLAPPSPSNQLNVTETAVSDDVIIPSNQNKQDGADLSGGENCGGNWCGFPSISIISYVLLFVSLSMSTCAVVSCAFVKIKDGPYIGLIADYGAPYDRDNCKLDYWDDHVYNYDKPDFDDNTSVVARVYGFLAVAVGVVLCVLSMMSLSYYPRWMWLVMMIFSFMNAFYESMTLLIFESDSCTGSFYYNYSGNYIGDGCKLSIGAALAITASILWLSCGILLLFQRPSSKVVARCNACIGNWLLFRRFCSKVLARCNACCASGNCCASSIVSHDPLPTPPVGVRPNLDLNYTSQDLKKVVKEIINTDGSKMIVTTYEPIYKEKTVVTEYVNFDSTKVIKRTNEKYDLEES